MTDAAATERVDILIAGASFAGLALARALAASLGPACRIAILDRVPVAARLGQADTRASALSASSRRVLQALRVWPLLADEAEPIRRIDITDSALDAAARPVALSYDNALPAEPGEPASHIVPNTALLAALARALGEDRSVRIIAPAEPVALAAAPGSGAASVRLADGRTFSAALCVAADGRRSFLREAAGIKVVGWRYAQTGIVTTISHERPHDGVAVQHFLPSGPFAILPLVGHRACVTWSEDAKEAGRILALDDAGFLDEVARRVGGRLGAVRLEGPRASWPLEMHLARHYVAPRLALVGDAAHGVHPIAGQGLNLALRDIAALAECVVEAMRIGLDPGDASLLERYERWRRPDAAMSALAFDGLNRLFSSNQPLLRTVRDAGLGLVDRLAPLKQLLVAEAAGTTGELPRLVRGEMI